VVISELAGAYEAGPAGVPVPIGSHGADKSVLSNAWVGRGCDWPRPKRPAERRRGLAHRGRRGQAGRAKLRRPVVQA
jgi:hypothetical protein